MKKIFVLTALVFSTAIYSNIHAQLAPAGAGDKELRDTDVKRRSVDMERVDRDAKKKPGKTTENAAAAAKVEEDKLAAKYGEIKTDYEQIQLSQDAIIKAYQGSGKIDYALISKSALEINNSAVRLNSNLFSALDISVENKEVNKEEKTEKETKPAKGIRELIIDLDKAVGSFVTSPIFQNLRTVDAEAAAKAKLDLKKISDLSAALGTQSKIAADGGK